MLLGLRLTWLLQFLLLPLCQRLLWTLPVGPFARMRLTLRTLSGPLLWTLRAGAVRPLARRRWQLRWLPLIWVLGLLTRLRHLLWRRLSLLMPLLVLQSRPLCQRL